MSENVVKLIINQKLNGLTTNMRCHKNTAVKYRTKIEMLIITPDGNQAFVNACKPLMDWKNEKGVKTIILSNYSSYAGVDNAEKVRNMIKSYDATENLKWVLLAGDAESGLIPVREVYNPDVIVVGGGTSEYSDWSDYYKPTDFYYADLTGTWDQDTDGNLILYTPFGMVRVLSGQWVVRYELGDNVFYTAMNTKEIKDNYEFK